MKFIYSFHPELGIVTKRRVKQDKKIVASRNEMQIKLKNGSVIQIVGTDDFDSIAGHGSTNKGERECIAT